MLGFRATESVNKVLQNAGKIAATFGNSQIGTEHLLYGIVSVEDSVSSKVLKKFGVTSENLSNILQELSGGKKYSVASQTLELTPRSKEVFVIANQFANQIGHNFIGTEHLLISILLSDDSYAVNVLQRYFRVNTNDLKNVMLQILKSESINNFGNDFGAFNKDSNLSSSAIGENAVQQSKLPKTLLEMGQDLTLKAKENKIDPIIGREEEISRVIEILCRKTKNNPVLIGEAGVGKSAVVDGLALAIVNGNVPEQLKNKTIFSLELGGLMADTQYRGSLETKLKELIETIKNDKSIIVFIDEIHTLMQAGSGKGEINPADMLKPYLARGEFQTIGATTTEEYRKFVEKDKAMERRFQPIMVNPPSVEDTIKILQGLKDSYEAFHKIKISDEAITAAATLSDRYIMDRSLPDKAIDLIDEASSRAKIRINKKPDELVKLEEDILKFEAEKKEALIAEDFEKAGYFRDKIRDASNRRNEIIKNNNERNLNITIKESDICDIISDWTHIPVSKITETEKDKLLNLESILHKRVIGQDEAVTAVSKAIRRARIGLKDSKRPIGSFLFLGQTGVGKTELCKALAEAMFDDENNIVRLDMSEYMEKHSISKLIGAPPGYVGFDEAGQLTEAVRRKPYSVVLFDEIEKAHPDVFNMLLQILDDGRLTDSQGRTVSFKNTIIILTSNIGVSDLPKRSASLGFSSSEEDDNSELNYDEIKEILMKAVHRHFKPEFINRIDVITVFHPLNFKELAQIAKIFISNLNKKLNDRDVYLKVTESALKYLINKGYTSNFGARPLRRLIEQEIEDRIAEEMLNGNVNKGNTIVIQARDNKLKLLVEKNNNK